MSAGEHIYILGAGAVGLPLAVYLVNHGRTVTAVRTSRKDISLNIAEVTIQGRTDQVSRAAVEMVSLSKLEKMSGLIVIAAKSYANKEIAYQLKDKKGNAPIVILQNGLGVEKPFIDSGFMEIYRCILYVTGQQRELNYYSFNSIASSPIGIIEGSEERLRRIVKALNTEEFAFHEQPDIQKEVWKKAIINSVFNSICPLLEIDNGIFVRDEKAEEMAREIVQECIPLTNRLNLELTENEIMEQIYTISKKSDGQFISTLQDINEGRETEIESLNIAISRAAEDLKPTIDVGKTKLMGNMILLKSKLKQNRSSCTNIKAK
jgi:2-dehydropantoate 2-reductase